MLPQPAAKWSVPVALLCVLTACTAHSCSAPAWRPGSPWQEVTAADDLHTDLHIDLGTTGRLGVRPWTPA